MYGYRLTFVVHHGLYLSEVFINGRWYCTCHRIIAISAHLLKSSQFLNHNLSIEYRWHLTTTRRVAIPENSNSPVTRHECRYLAPKKLTKLGFFPYHVSSIHKDAILYLSWKWFEISHETNIYFPGAIYARGNTLAIDDSVFTGNSALDNGGRG